MPNVKPFLQAGFLRHSVTIERPPATLDDAGEQTGAWTKVIDMRASIEPLSGRELQLAREMFADQTHRIKAYFTPGLDATMRVKFGTRYFNILSVLNIEERNRWLQIECQEIVA